MSQMSGLTFKVLSCQKLGLLLFYVQLKVNANTANVLAEIQKIPSLIENSTKLNPMRT